MTGDTTLLFPNVVETGQGGNLLCEHACLYTRDGDTSLSHKWLVTALLLWIRQQSKFAEGRKCIWRSAKRFFAHSYCKLAEVLEQDLVSRAVRVHISPFLPAFLNSIFCWLTLHFKLLVNESWAWAALPGKDPIFISRTFFAASNVILTQLLRAHIYAISVSTSRQISF